MNKVDTSLLCLEFASVAFGYKALDALLKSNAEGSRIRVLDASTASRRFIILALSETKLLDEGRARIRALTDGLEPSLLSDSELIENFDQQVLKSLFALSEIQLGESLVVVECETLSGCLEAAQGLVRGHGLQTIEIRINRSGNGGAIGFFTGLKKDCGPAAEDARSNWKNGVRKGRIETIDQPSPDFRKYFET